MTEPILEESYWRVRLQQARQRHHAIFKCPLNEWQRIEEKHRDILRDRIGDQDRILDAGCGWGRLLDLMPDAWVGDYTGIDLSPEFIDLAREEHPDKNFLVGDLDNLGRFFTIGYEDIFDWGILISIRPMMIRNLGQNYWNQVEKKLRRVCKDLLFLEYDEKDRGEIV